MIQRKAYHLEIEKFIQGQCFICKQNCQADAYAHFECCLAYFEEKNKRIKEYHNKLLEAEKR